MDEHQFRLEVVAGLRDLKGTIDALMDRQSRLESLPARVAAAEQAIAEAAARQAAEATANQAWLKWVRPLIFALLSAAVTIVLLHGPEIVKAK